MKVDTATRRRRAMLNVAGLDAMLFLSAKFAGVPRRWLSIMVSVLAGLGHGGTESRENARVAASALLGQQYGERGD